MPRKSLKVVPAMAGSAIALAELFPGCTLEAEVEVPASSDPRIPSQDPRYRWDDDLVRKLMWWHEGIGGKNLLLHGPTGSGKTEAIRQFCASMHLPLFAISCHEDARIGDLDGHFRLVAGTSSFAPGPLAEAFATPRAVILLDEVNYLPQGVAGKLNALLDGHDLLIEATGERVTRQESVRFAATANAVDGHNRQQHPGIYRLNRAFARRWRSVRVTYNRAVELLALTSAQPGIDRVIVQALVKWASDARALCDAGELADAPTTDTLLNMLDLIAVRYERVCNDWDREVGAIGAYCLTSRLPPAEEETLLKTLCAVKPRIAMGLKDALESRTAS